MNSCAEEYLPAVEIFSAIDSDSVKALLTAIGARLRLIRLASGLTVTELGRRSAVSPSVLSRLERGKRTLTFMALLQICAALGVSPVVVIEKAERDVFTMGGNLPWVASKELSVSVEAP